MVARAGLREAAPVAEMAALKIGCVCAQRAGHTRTHAEGEHLYLSGRSGRGRCGSANGGGEGGEDKDEGRVGVRSDNRPKNTTQAASPPRGETWIGHGMGKRGYIFTKGLYCEAVTREAAGRVGVPKQRLCVSSGASIHTAENSPVY